MKRPSTTDPSDTQGLERGALPASSKLQLEALVRESLETITIVRPERSQF